MGLKTRTVIEFPATNYRTDFPILDQEVNGFPLVYLDNAASTQHPNCVIDEIARYYRKDHANVHRGIHELSTRSTKLYEAARVRASKFMGAASPDSVIFTRGTTEGINLVASSWGGAHLGPGDTILITEIEHHDSENRKYQPTASRIISGSNWRHLNRPATEGARTILAKLIKALLQSCNTSIQAIRLCSRRVFERLYNPRQRQRLRKPVEPKPPSFVETLRNRNSLPPAWEVFVFKGKK